MRSGPAGGQVSGLGCVGETWVGLGNLHLFMFNGARLVGHGLVVLVGNCRGPVDVVRGGSGGGGLLVGVLAWIMIVDCELFVAVEPRLFLLLSLVCWVVPVFLLRIVLKGGGGGGGGGMDVGGGGGVGGGVEGSVDGVLGDGVVAVSVVWDVVDIIPLRSVDWHR